MTSYNQLNRYHQVKSYHHHVTMPPLSIIIIISPLSVIIIIVMSLPPPPLKQPHHNVTPLLPVCITLLLNFYTILNENNSSYEGVTGSVRGV